MITRFDHTETTAFFCHNTQLRNRLEYTLNTKQSGLRTLLLNERYGGMNIETEELIALVNEALNPPEYATKEILQIARDITPAVPVWEKYLLTVNEAVAYFGIGESKLRDFIATHKDEAFLVWNGSKALIKRKLFEKYIDTTLCTL